VIDWYETGGANQDWLLLPTGASNTYEIINANSNMCLTTDGVAGDQVYQEPCTSSTSQQWSTSLTSSSTGVHQIQSVYSGLYLDTWYDNGGANQYFARI
jgi:hypothetical protein